MAAAGADGTPGGTNMTLRSVVLTLVLCVAATALAVDTDLPAGLQAELDAMPDANARMERMAQLVQQSPDDVRYVFHHANYAFDANQLQQAAASYERAIELAPDLVGAHVNLGSVYDELGLLDDALASYDRALQLEPTEDRTLCNMGNVYFKKRQYEKAIEYFDKALEVNPQSQLAHYNMAILFADSEIYREAIAEFQKAVDIDPNSDLGRRSAENIGIIEQLLSADDPELGGR